MSARNLLLNRKNSFIDDRLKDDENHFRFINSKIMETYSTPADLLNYWKNKKNLSLCNITSSNLMIGSKSVGKEYASIRYGNKTTDIALRYRFERVPRFLHLTVYMNINLSDMAFFQLGLVNLKDNSYFQLYKLMDAWINQSGREYLFDKLNRGGNSVIINQTYKLDIKANYTSENMNKPHELDIKSVNTYSGYRVSLPFFSLLEFEFE